jgi:hypothetical protein
MKKHYLLLILLIIMVFTSYAYAANQDTKSFASDSIGIKLDYPSKWRVDEYQWGLMLTEPETNATFTAQAFFMPSELEQIYDINMNKEYELIYAGKYQNLEESEKEFAGKTWDYAFVKGGIGSDVEYFEKNYSLLLGNTVYSIEIFYESKVPEETVKTMDKVLDSMKLMYKESELPLVRNYMKKWKESKESKKDLNYISQGRKFQIDYSPPWLFLGGGLYTEGSFYYLLEDPFKDIGMFFVIIPKSDPVEAMNLIQDLGADYTSPYSVVGEETIKINQTECVKRILTQGAGEHIQNTSYYATKMGDQTLIAVFSYLKPADGIDYTQVMEDLLKKVSIHK